MMALSEEEAAARDVFPGVATTNARRRKLPRKTKMEKKTMKMENNANRKEDVVEEAVVDSEVVEEDSEDSEVADPLLPTKTGRQPRSLESSSISISRRSKRKELPR